jgi:hypothetical protein
MRVWRTGDAVSIAVGEARVTGTVLYASANGVSLMLQFDALLAGHLGMMPVLRNDEGHYRSVITGVAVELFDVA